MVARREHLWWASGLFVLSGSTGLVYETVWFKSLGHAWGNSSLAMASVVASFLFGLGLGAWIFGRIADRIRSPLALYGWCELAIGAFALLIPLEIGWLLEGAAGLSVSWSSSPVALALLRFALTLAVIGPPCVLMGATLPLLTRQFATQGMSVGGSTAWLYAFNSLGAACGAWCAGFFMLERFGLAWTNGLAAALNAAVGVGALALAPRFAAPLGAASEEPQETGLDPVHPRSLAFAALASGLGSITLQMLWARELALIVGATTYAFSATITVFILGLALGSLWFRVSFATRRAPSQVVCLASGLVVLPSLASAAAEPGLAELVGHLRVARASGAFNALLCLSIAACIQLLPAIGMGLLFPALVRLSRASATHAGHAVARVYAWNTVGSITGAATAALVVLPALGSFWSTRAALLVFALLPLLLFARQTLALVTSIACGALLLSTWKAPDPLALNSGMFLYGAQARQELSERMQVEYFQEGAACNVLVLSGQLGQTPQDDERVVNLRVNGKIDASTGQDMPMQLGIAYIPRFLRPRASRVAVIGMGSGVTAGAAALFPNTEVTVCEIEPSVLEATRYFESVNHRPLDRGNVHTVLDDGRSYLQGHPGPWDLVLSEPSNPWIAGIASLFTEEFYTAIREKLTPQGVLAQWVQTYSFSVDEYALVVRTVQRVFPHCAFVRVSEYDTLLLAANSELFPPGAALDEAQQLVLASPEIAADLERWFGTRDIRSILLPRLWLDAGGLRRFVAAVGGESINTDRNLQLEFSAPRRLFHALGDTSVRTFQLLASAVDPALQQRLCAQWNCGPAQLPALRELKTTLFQFAQVAQATAIVELGLAYDPDDPELAVDRLLFDASVTREEFDAQSARIIESSPLEALRLARQLGQLAQHNAARVVLETLTTRLPSSATAWLALSGEYRALGRVDDAERALARARELDPIDDLLRSLGNDAER